MFTGIIKAVGTIQNVEERAGDRRLTIRSDGLDWAQFALGESIAVNGVCLTATELTESGFFADVSRETLDITTVGEWVAGSRVNLEPSLALGERMGGHLVSGHVDCLGEITGRREDGGSLRVDIAVPAEFARYIARKGSVAIDGTSLTVNAVDGPVFGVNLVPHTAEVTVAGDYRPGQRVNIEVDMLARYLESLLDKAPGEGVTREFLKAHGYG